MTEIQYHIRVSENDVGKYVLLPGDPGRCESIANYFDNPQFVSFNREHKVYTGYINGEKVGEVSDNAYSAGYFGIYLNRDKTENMTIYVDDVKYWDNPTVQ